MVRNNVSNGTQFDVSSGTYLYHQPCVVWNVEYSHGCGYTPDIDAIDCDQLISLVDSNFIAELPRFQGNEYHNILIIIIIRLMG